MANKIGCFIIDLQGTELTAEECDMLSHPLVGGVILFSRNYVSRVQLTTLCHQIRAAASQPRLIMVDQEGGRVQRFVKEFTLLPPMGYFGKKYNDSPIIAQEFVQNCGWLMAIELLATGVDLSLTPIIDLNKGKNTVIGDRALHLKPEAVIHLARAFIQGMHEAGMASTGKHFPGHGSVEADSHSSLPVDERSLKEIKEDDLLPFIHLCKKDLSAIMAAHIVYPQVDDLPVGFSCKWLQEILRDQLKFNGMILSDDLNMAGANISNSYVDRVTFAREAGCDLVLLCNNRQGVIEVLDHLPYQNHLIDKAKWGILQGDFLSQHKAYTDSTRWQLMHELLLSEMQHGSH